MERWLHRGQESKILSCLILLGLTSYLPVLSAVHKYFHKSICIRIDAWGMVVLHSFEWKQGNIMRSFHISLAPIIAKQTTAETHRCSSSTRTRVLLWHHASEDSPHIPSHHGESCPVAGPRQGGVWWKCNHYNYWNLPLQNIFKNTDLADKQILY